jgi:hypothetical protein
VSTCAGPGCVSDSVSDAVFGCVSDSVSTMLRQAMAAEQRLAELVSLHGVAGVDWTATLVRIEDSREQYRKQLAVLRNAVLEWEDQHGELLMHRGQRLLACVDTCLEVTPSCVLPRGVLVPRPTVLSSCQVALAVVCRTPSTRTADCVR